MMTPEVSRFVRDVMLRGRSRLDHSDSFEAEMDRWAMWRQTEDRMCAEGQRSPRILFEEPGYPAGTPPTRFIVALDVHWGRILDRHTQRYYPTEQIGTILAMSYPWQGYTGPQDVLADWLAQAHDLEAEMTPQERARIAWRRELQVAQFCSEVLHAAQAQRSQGSRSTRPEAVQDQQAMWEQIAQRIEEVAREARTLTDVPGWLWDLAAQLGIEP